MRRVNMIGCVCLSASVCCSYSNFESLDLEISFLVWQYVFRIYGLSSYNKVVASRSRSQDQKSVSVCPVCAVIFESFDIETSFLVCKYIFQVKFVYQGHRVLRSRS